MAKRVDLDKGELARMFCIENLPLHRIATHFECTRQLVAKRISEYGLIRNYENPKWLEERHYIDGLGFDQMAKLANCSYESIRINMAMNGFKALSEIRYRGVKKYSYDESYFDSIDTPDKAYWLGFILADGCVSPEACNTYRLSIQLQKQDDKHLQKFLDAIKSNAPIKYGQARRNAKRTEWAKIRINSSHMCYSLMDLGIMPNKSTKEKIPVIREELHRDFIRGVFDGDGCFHTPNPYRGIFSIVGSYDVVSYIAKYLRKELNIPVSFRLQKGSLYFMAVYRYENVRAVLDWLYDDSTTFLDRKYNHYINWLASKLSPEERTKEIGLKISRNRKILRGEESPRAKLTESKVREIMRLRTEDALTYKNIASMFGVRCSTIQSVLNGNTWSHITGLENARVKYRREE